MNEALDFSLQERDYARTKLTLLRVAIAKIHTRPLAEISVKEICKTVPVPEMAFYTCFPRKTDLLIYYFQVIGLEAAWYLRHALKHKTCLEMVEESFDFLARKLAAEPLMMTEALAYLGQERQRPDFEPLSKAERLLAFPNLIGIEELDVKDTRIETLIEPYLEQAIQQGELPRNLDLDTIVLICMSIFVGFVMNLHLTEPKRIRPLCRRQLRLLWKALNDEFEETGSIAE